MIVSIKNEKDKEKINFHIDFAFFQKRLEKKVKYESDINDNIVLSSEILTEYLLDGYYNIIYVIFYGQMNIVASVGIDRKVVFLGQILLNQKKLGIIINETEE